MTPIIVQPGDGVAGETVVLDPEAIASGRIELDITHYIRSTTGARSAGGGVDWGDAEIQAYMADQAVGSSPVDYRLPNRQINIPLSLRDVGGTSFATIRSWLQAKAALFQREGGWIMRQVGTTSLYADVVNATLHLGGSWLQAYRSGDIDATLQLECVPDWYGDEVTLDSASATGALTGRLKQSSSDAFVTGNHPGRCRIIVTDTSANDQRGLIWGFRSRNYDSAATAALSYEAEALTPLGGAATATLAGASGGSVVRASGLPIGSWVSILSTNVLSGNQPLTQHGSYRVWARCYSTPYAARLRLQWAVGTLSTPVTNDPVELKGANNFYLVSLGDIRLDSPPVGSMQWFGVIQVYADAALAASIDQIFLQPLDEAAGALAFVQSIPASLISAQEQPTVGADDSSNGGTLAWSNPDHIEPPTWPTVWPAFATFAGVTATSHYLKATGFGFSIPGGATIQGIAVAVQRSTPDSAGDASRGITRTLVSDSAVRLVKAGTVQATDRADTAFWPQSAATHTYGGTSDLWGGTWTPTDINNTNFGAVIAAKSAIGGQPGPAYVYSITITVYYTLAGGFAVAQDAVIYASQIAELRTEGMVRDNSGGVYGPVSRVVGDLPRLPPSGIEDRVVELFVKPSRGNLDDQPDNALDGFTAQVKYRPSYLYVPE